MQGAHILWYVPWHACTIEGLKTSPEQGREAWLPGRRRTFRRGLPRARRGSLPAPIINLLYVSTSFLWWQAVAGIIGVQSSHALRSHARRTWRHREGSRNAHNTAICRALSPWRPCGVARQLSTADPRGVAPSRHHTASRDISVTVHGRRNAPIASYSS